MDDTKQSIHSETDDEKPEQVSVSAPNKFESLVKLYKYLSAPYYFMAFVGIICAMAGGASLAFIYRIVQLIGREMDLDKSHKDMAGKAQTKYSITQPTKLTYF